MFAQFADSMVIGFIGFGLMAALVFLGRAAFGEASLWVEARRCRQPLTPTERAAYQRYLAAQAASTRPEGAAEASSDPVEGDGTSRNEAAA